MMSLQYREVGAGEREAFRVELARLAPELAEFIADPLTTVEEVPVTFLRVYRLYFVVVYAVIPPVLVYAAHAPGRGVYLLNGDPQSLARVLGAEGTMLDTAEQAQAFVDTMIETTRDMRGLTRVVSSLSDIPYAELLTTAQRTQKRRGEGRLRAAMGPPRVERQGAGWNVTVWVARGSRVHREHYLIANDGTIMDFQIDNGVALPLISVL